MIPTGVQVFVALELVDMRCGFERLSGLVRERVGYEPRSAALYVFFGKRRASAKILFFDGTGLCVFYKRLDEGTFALPPVPTDGATHIEVDDATPEALLGAAAADETARPGGAQASGPARIPSRAAMNQRWM